MLRARSVTFALGLAANACRPTEVVVEARRPVEYFPVTHGVAAGDVTQERVVLWGKTDRYAAMHVRVTGGGTSRHAARFVDAGHDYAGKIVVSSLTPGTRYEYTVWFSSSADDPVPPRSGGAAGTFRTPPASERAEPVTFGWSGDLGGINVCRDAHESYPIFRTLTGKDLDFFIGLGDMIYGDQACDARGFYGNDQIPGIVREATTEREYWAHWRYNREDAGFRALLASTAYYGVWDDHEVMNDFGPKDSWHTFPPYTVNAHLIPLGRHALFDWNPIYEDPLAPERFYVTHRWGKELELVTLDTRSYRDLNTASDRPETQKTLLGAEQRAWLERTLVSSGATWKILVSSVPISLPTGRGGDAGRDGWSGYDGSTGFARELLGILRGLRDAHVKNVLFITTDVHFATGFRYHPFPDAPDFVFYEFTAGPLGAMLLPHHALDESLHPERLFFFPEEAPKSYEEARRAMNWGRIAIDAGGTLTHEVRDGLGETVARTVIPAER